VLAFIAFRRWLRHQRDVMVHRERMVALEKGLEPPAWPEPARPGLGVGGVLLLSGLIWLAVGIGGTAAAFVVSPNLTIPDGPPPGSWLFGLIPCLVGVAHLVVYRTQRGRR
jgi:hypothetical protein